MNSAREPRFNPLVYSNVAITSKLAEYEKKPINQKLESNYSKLKKLESISNFESLFQNIIISRENSFDNEIIEKDSLAACWRNVERFSHLTGIHIKNLSEIDGINTEINSIRQTINSFKWDKTNDSKDSIIRQLTLAKNQILDVENKFHVTRPNETCSHYQDYVGKDFFTLVEYQITDSLTIPHGTQVVLKDWKDPKDTNCIVDCDGKDLELPKMCLWPKNMTERGIQESLLSLHQIFNEKIDYCKANGIPCPSKIESSFESNREMEMTKVQLDSTLCSILTIQTLLSNLESGKIAKLKEMALGLKEFNLKSDAHKIFDCGTQTIQEIAESGTHSLAMNHKTLNLGVQTDNNASISDSSTSINEQSAYARTLYPNDSSGGIIMKTGTSCGTIFGQAFSEESKEINAMVQAFVNQTQTITLISSLESSAGHYTQPQDDASSVKTYILSNDNSLLNSEYSTQKQNSLTQSFVSYTTSETSPCDEPITRLETKRIQTESFDPKRRPSGTQTTNNVLTESCTSSEHSLENSFVQSSSRKHFSRLNTIMSENDNSTYEISSTEACIENSSNNDHSSATDRSILSFGDSPKNKAISQTDQIESNKPPLEVKSVQVDLLEPSVEMNEDQRTASCGDDEWLSKKQNVSSQTNVGSKIEETSIACYIENGVGLSGVNYAGQIVLEEGDSFHIAKNKESKQEITQTKGSTIGETLTSSSSSINIVSETVALQNSHVATSKLGVVQTECGVAQIKTKLAENISFHIAEDRVPIRANSACQTSEGLRIEETSISCKNSLGIEISPEKAVSQNSVAPFMSKLSKDSSSHVEENTKSEMVVGSKSVDSIPAVIAKLETAIVQTEMKALVRANSACQTSEGLRIEETSISCTNSLGKEISKDSSSHVEGNTKSEMALGRENPNSIPTKTLSSSCQTAFNSENNSVVSESKNLQKPPSLIPTLEVAIVQTESLPQGKALLRANSASQTYADLRIEETSISCTNTFDMEVVSEQSIEQKSVNRTKLAGDSPFNNDAENTKLVVAIVQSDEKRCTFSSCQTSEGLRIEETSISSSPIKNVLAESSLRNVATKNEPLSCSNTLAIVQTDSIAEMKSQANSSCQTVEGLRIDETLLSCSSAKNNKINPEQPNTKPMIAVVQTDQATEAEKKPLRASSSCQTNEGLKIEETSISCSNSNGILVVAESLSLQNAAGRKEPNEMKTTLSTCQTDTIVQYDVFNQSTIAVETAPSRGTKPQLAIVQTDYLKSSSVIQTDMKSILVSSVVQTSQALKVDETSASLSNSSIEIVPEKSTFQNTSAITVPMNSSVVQTDKEKHVTSISQTTQEKTDSKGESKLAITQTAHSQPTSTSVQNVPDFITTKDFESQTDSVKYLVHSNSYLETQSERTSLFHSFDEIRNSTNETTFQDAIELVINIPGLADAQVQTQENLFYVNEETQSDYTPESITETEYRDIQQSQPRMEDCTWDICLQVEEIKADGKGKDVTFTEDKDISSASDVIMSKNRMNDSSNCLSDATFLNKSNMGQLDFSSDGESNPDNMIWRLNAKVINMEKAIGKWPKSEDFKAENLTKYAIKASKLASAYSAHRSNNPYEETYPMQSIPITDIGSGQVSRVKPFRNNNQNAGVSSPTGGTRPGSLQRSTSNNKMIPDKNRIVSHYDNTENKRASRRNVVEKKGDSASEPKSLRSGNNQTVMKANINNQLTSMTSSIGSNKTTSYEKENQISLNFIKIVNELSDCSNVVNWIIDYDTDGDEKVSMSLRESMENHLIFLDHSDGEYYLQQDENTRISLNTAIRDKIVTLRRKLHLYFLTKYEKVHKECIITGVRIKDLNKIVSATVAYELGYLRKSQDASRNVSVKVSNKWLTGEEAVLDDILLVSELTSSSAPYKINNELLDSIYRISNVIPGQVEEKMDPYDASEEELFDLNNGNLVIDQEGQDVKVCNIFDAISLNRVQLDKVDTISGYFSNSRIISSEYQDFREKLC